MAIVLMLHNKASSVSRSSNAHSLVFIQDDRGLVLACCFVLFQEEVNKFCSQYALVCHRLPVLAFEGATKRNKPNVQIGDLVFARVVTAGKHIEAELSCVNASGKSGGFGQISGGYMFACSSGLCRSLRRPNNPILTALSSNVAFEIVVGLNGRVWVNAVCDCHSVYFPCAVFW